MPRGARQVSFTGNYHVMLRGINKQDIFLDKQDYLKFIKEMKITKEKYNYSIYSYVLMPNHVHIEIKDNENNISKIMHRLAVSYSSYFNKKYNRIGHVFQDRYNSKVIENNEYLMNLMRYIHQNPEKAKISKTCDYRWSSYKDYIYKDGLTDTKLILNLFSKDETIALSEFTKYNNKILSLKESKDILEYEISLKLTDEQLIYIIKNKIGEENIFNIQRFNKKHRKEIIQMIKGIKGTSKMQISRVLGINRKELEL